MENYSKYKEREIENIRKNAQAQQPDQGAGQQSEQQGEEGSSQEQNNNEQQSDDSTVNTDYKENQ